MTDYVSLYDPPLSNDLEAHRLNTLYGDDAEMFAHVGHFIAWYASVEFMLTFLLHSFSGQIDARAFDVLTRGMDVRVKIERLGKTASLAGWKLDPGLLERIGHFQDVHIPLRNRIVHSYLYWPDGGPLQMCGTINPPIFQDTRWDVPEPYVIPGIDLFERGAWLGHFSQDLIAIHEALTSPLAASGTLGNTAYISSLPPAESSSGPQRIRRAGLRKRTRPPVEE